VSLLQVGINHGSSPINIPAMETVRGWWQKKSANSGSDQRWGGDNASTIVMAAVVPSSR